jgi:hypothetical protein
MRPMTTAGSSAFPPRERVRPPEMFHLRHTRVTDTCAGDRYGVCRSPGGPLGAVTDAAGLGGGS